MILQISNYVDCNIATESLVDIIDDTYNSHCPMRFRQISFKDIKLRFDHGLLVKFLVTLRENKNIFALQI